MIVPQTGDVFLQEDSDGEQYVRGVTRNGRIYDFALTLLNHSEFCGGCFSPDGEHVLPQPAGRAARDGQTPTLPLEEAGLTFAIWGPFDGPDEHQREAAAR